MRIENDLLGSLEIPADVLYGIHSLRAKENFPDRTAFHDEWYRAAGTVKRACYISYLHFSEKVRQQYPGVVLPQPLIGEEIMDKLIAAAAEIEEGMHMHAFIVPAIQGGAGTSINMNVNEIIANRALVMSGHKPGDYAVIDPVEHANIFQSTNDVIPTSLRLAMARLFLVLEKEINELRSLLEEKEKNNRNALRIGYTQMQGAVPSSYGRLFSTYCDALSRDWWRVSKCLERIKTINLGGSAIGTGITVPRFFISEVHQVLRTISGIAFSKAENLQDATSNLDAFVEVHAILKAHAVNLEKMVSDLRLLSSDLVQKREVEIPGKQAGSSIMPGKINPVIPEFVISSAHKIYSNDQLITSLSGQGCLDLNAYIPVIGHALLESLKLLIACDQTCKLNLISGLHVNSGTAAENLADSPAISTALLPYVGYHKASLLANAMKENQCSIVEANRKLNLIPEQKLLTILTPENLLKEGFTIQDIMDDNG